MNDELIKKIALDFYNFYHSFPSPEADSEFDKWWAGNAYKYSQWNPIETVPKNRNILAVDENNKIKVLIYCGKFGWLDNFGYYQKMPIAWQELPKFNGVINNG